MSEAEQHYFKVYQLPIEEVVSVFPHLGLVWNDLHQRWLAIKKDASFLQAFQASQDTPESQVLFRESGMVPDTAKYQRLEQKGFKEVYGYSFEARPLSQGWMLNRGKISYSRLAWMVQFEQRGIFWYPNGGYREWHTNHPYDGKSQNAGWRIYFVDTDGKSAFHYLDTKGKMQIARDKPLFANIFYLPPVKLFWHAVVSNGNRFSCGFRPLGPAVDRLTQMIEEID
ncbi:MAG: hypothetical protein VX278_20190 [Myxococcota bacterium]|nr:hypothetical protein [Myxococcota bacterium]